MNILLNKIFKRLKIYIGYILVNLRRFILELKHSSSVQIEIELKRNGFIKLADFGVPGATEYLQKIIKNPIECENNPNYKIIMNNDFGVKTIAIDIRDSFLQKYILNKNLYNLISSYYGGKFYLRNNPVIMFHYPGEVASAQTVHLDWGLRQVSMMVNLNLIDESSTHMEYLLKSNQEYYFRQRDRNSRVEKSRVENYLRTSEIATTCGDVDTVSIFDAGCGYHRQIGGGFRVMLHLNFTDNLAFTSWDASWKGVSERLPSEYWFSKFDSVGLKIISKSDLPQDFYALVYQTLKPAIGVPKVYTNNC